MIETQTINAELVTCIDLLEKWREKIKDGIPGLDGVPVSDESFTDTFLHKLEGELNLVSGKCANLASLVAQN